MIININNENQSPELFEENGNVQEEEEADESSKGQSKNFNDTSKSVRF